MLQFTVGNVRSIEMAFRKQFTAVHKTMCFH